MPPTTNISALMYTSPGYLPICELACDHIRLLPEWPLQTYLACSNFPEQYLNTTNISPCEAIIFPQEKEVEGEQWREVIIHALSKISSKYVLCLLDDFMITAVNWQVILNEIVPIVEEHDYTNISFQAVEFNTTHFTPPAIQYNTTNFTVWEVSSEWQYKNSVQPAIWNREHLLHLLQSNSTAKLHSFDINHNIVDNSEFKRLVTNNFPNASGRKYQYHQPLFQYTEIIRWGGFNISESSHTIPFIKDLIEKYDLKNKERYSPFFDAALRESISLHTHGIY